MPGHPATGRLATGGEPATTSPTGRRPAARRTWVGMLVLLLVFAAACGSDDDDSDTPDTTTAEEAGAEFDEYIGLSEQEAADRAEEEGRPWRVVERDGEALPVTMDFVPERLNFVVEAGTVAEVTTG